MGKRILQRRAGKGGIQFRSPTKGKLDPARYPSPLLGQTFDARVSALVHERGRSTPLARLEYGGGKSLVPAVLGLEVGQLIRVGPDASATTGNILPLAKIPEGTSICNIELTPGSGGELVKSAGTSAILFSHTPGGAVVRLPSGKSKVIDERCRATVGILGAGGKMEKPFLRAGSRERAMIARGKMYPRVRGIAMTTVYHPFGGGRHQHPGKSTSTSRNAPPGRKVGLIAPRKTGRKRMPRRLEAGSR